MNNYAKNNKIMMKVGLCLLVISPFGVYLIYKYLNYKINKNNKKKAENNKPLNNIDVNMEDISLSNNQSSFIDCSNTFNASSLSSSILPSNFLSEKSVLKILSKVMDIILNNLTLAYNSIREDKEHINKHFTSDMNTFNNYTVKKFKDDILVNIIKENLKLYESMKIAESDYLGSLKQYLLTNKNDLITKRFNLIEKIINDFKIHDSINIDIEFPKELKENYLKIISNIFYLNLKKVAVKIKNEHLETGARIPELKIETFYQEYIKLTRKIVLNYFKVKGNDIKASSLLRYYVFTLNNNDPVRIHYQQLNDILFLVEANMKNGIIPEEFIDQTNSINDQIKNEIVDMKNLTAKTLDYKLLNCI